ncbi:MULTISPECIES: helix-turn-helix domain-containing protein [Streptococcus]|uniref:XRE family transcriptional regulator n=2 Tax=Streptococcus dysgalactiae TaxID=1334 RepID=A0A9X7S5S4_STRDY|nr:helix-turn-helix transcriptional regulator [Streptococcus dysgalactiae]QBX22613.1 cro-like protein [Streptococcus phage Javan91]HEP2841394.1 helix-turn-helix transcriptional regulator [Streptococcus pyogenes]HER4816299.1 helix-turn-helix transcriptional regulator [Streptococcus pyogenes NGAS025]MEC4578033.1 helix-turn-helix transcriptional regulator [Streptococcus dysgalactiae]QGH01415.1 XRE family transcriptional regulator [Streptococcus dysgalactiae subsp. dysgalactiae]
MNELQPTITILEIRAKNKMTQAEFGDSIGVSAQSVSSWERDICSISPRNLIKICHKYGVSSVDLLGA